MNAVSFIINFDKCSVNLLKYTPRKANLNTKKRQTWFLSISLKDGSQLSPVLGPRPRATNCMNLFCVVVSHSGIAFYNQFG